jgi:glutathione S-transferase
MSEFTLYGVPGSPYVRSALLGLEEKGADYRFSPIPFGTTRSAEHLARHPFGRMPVIDHGDFRLYETQAILRYVDAVVPGPALQPRDPKIAARMNQIIGIVDCYVMRFVSAPISAERLFAQRFWNRPANETVVAEALPNARICIQELDRLKGEADYMTGDAVSIADLMLAPAPRVFRHDPRGRGDAE